MQRTALAAFVGAACANHSKNVDVKKLELIVGGILKGAVDAEGFTDISSCIKDAETVFADA